MWLPLATVTGPSSLCKKSQRDQTTCFSHEIAQGPSETGEQDGGEGSGREQEGGVVGVEAGESWGEDPAEVAGSLTAHLLSVSLSVLYHQSMTKDSV